MERIGTECSFFPEAVWPPERAPDRTHSAWALRDIARTGFDLVHSHTLGAVELSGLCELPMLHTLHHDIDPAFSEIYQAARELLLAQASDWAFIIKTGTMVEYAVRRTKDHLLRFTKLYDQLKGHGVDEGWLSTVESRDNLFPEIDYRVYRAQG